MRFKWYLIVTSFLLFSACSREINSWKSDKSYAGHDLERVIDRDTKTVIRETDSTVLSPAPVERSTSLGIDSSYLSTSLSWSTAVWKDGNLKHEIGNFPLIPGKEKTRYLDREVIIHDTLRLRDTVKIYNNERVEKVSGISWIDRAWVFIGKISSLAIVLYVAWKKTKNKWKLLF